MEKVVYKRTLFTDFKRYFPNQSMSVRYDIADDLTANCFTDFSCMLVEMKLINDVLMTLEVIVAPTLHGKLTCRDINPVYFTWSPYVCNLTTSQPIESRF